MKKISLCNSWQYRHLQGEDWKNVTLPHDAMLSEPRTKESAGGKNVSYFEGRDYVYRRELSFERKEGHRYILEFEGVYHNAKVYLGGEEIASCPYGYSGFYADVTGRTATDLEVYAYNSDQPNSRWYSGAGIYRPVWLYDLPERHICMDGVGIETVDAAAGKLRVCVETSHGGPFQAEVLEDGKTVFSGVGEGELKCSIPRPRLWSPESPFLYTLRINYCGDIREIAFGVRTVECNSRDGLLLNGKRIVLRGACIHHDNGLLGACAYPDAEERKIALMKRAGYNAVRSAHNPCSKSLLTACDRLGMLVLDEYADMWYIHKTRYDYASVLPDRWKQDLEAMVKKDRNHPSVIMYSIGNEVSETAEERGIDLSGDMRTHILTFDKTRPVTCGVNIFFNYLSALGFGVYSDKKAEKAGKKGKEREVGSAFFNKLAGLLGDKTMKIGAMLHGSDVKTRKHFAKMDVAGYNYGILRYEKDVKKYPDRVILGTETFVKDAWRFLRLAEKHKAVIGDFVWAGMDYLGEVGVGASEFSDYAKNLGGGFGWISAGSGRVDLTGKELAEALYTKVVFGILPIAIASVPANSYKKKHSSTAWGMTNARESWSWNGCDGKKTAVEVYCRAPKVSLFVNGKRVGTKKTRKTARTIFKTKYFGGKVEAVGYDGTGKELCRTSLKTAGEETKLTLGCESQARRGRLLYVRCRFTDGEGTTKPLARAEIGLEVTGGKLLAFGNACPYNERGYLSDRSDTYYGEALAIVLPTEERICLRASSALGCAELCLATR